jgi:predicted transcriptional regulator
MPKQPHRMLLGVFDENSYIIMGNLYKTHKSFPDLLVLTALPKSSLYVALMKLVQNGLVLRDGSQFNLSEKGLPLYEVLASADDKSSLIRENKEVPVVEQQVSPFTKLLNGIRRILRK